MAERRYNNETYSWLYKWGQRNRQKRLADLSSGKVLDVGWYQNPNRFLKGAIGLDIKEDRNPPENYVQTFTLTDDKYPFRDEEFDTVILGEVIEHIINVNNTLEEVNRVLKKGGLLIISTPNPAAPVCALMQMITWLKKDKSGWVPGDHVHEFLVQDMLTLLDIKGFDTVSYEGTFAQIPFTNIQFPAPLPISYQTIYVARKR